MSAAQTGICAGPRQRGVSLIELIAFIVIMAVASVALLSMYRGVLPHGLTPAQITIANLLAQERMELILGQRIVDGYSTSVLADPCVGGTPPVICTDLTTAGSPVGLYSIIVTGISPAVTWSATLGASTVRTIGVEVLGPDGATAANLSAIIANY